MKKGYLFLLLSSLIISQVFAQQTINGSFDFDGKTRTYSFYVPASYVSGQATALVLNLHGYTSNGSQQDAYTNFEPIADTANFIIVHPDGTHDLSNNRFWNYGIPGAKVNDLGFLEALIDTISAHYTIDQSRVYSCGISNGAIMSYYLAYKTNRFAAIASVAGTMTKTMYNNCNPSHPIPIMEIHGTTDPRVPYNGNASEKPIEDVVDLWVGLNNCDTIPNITQVPNTTSSDGATAEHYVYSNGTYGHTVEFYKVKGGGHTWPGGTVAIPAYGNTCMDFNASKEIWRFFSQYRRPLGIEKGVKAENYVTVFPNPAKNEIYIRFSKNIMQPYTLTIYDMQGKAVLQSQENKRKLHITLHQFKTGLYLLKINNDKLKITKRIIIEE